MGKTACRVASYIDLLLQHQPVPSKLLVYLAEQNTFFFSGKLEEHLTGRTTRFHNVWF